MYHGQIVFSQIMDYFPRRRFKSCVNRYRGDHRVKTFTCLDQFYGMTFAQLTGRESLRDIEACLRAAGPKLYHAEIKARVSRTTLAKANEQRDWRIYRDIALILIDQARRLYVNQPLAMNLKRAVYALDSTVVDLSLTLSPWTIARLYKFRWQIELFFKWIKQHLRIKAFYGTTPNAVKTQVWIAISVYVLVAILKKELNLQASMYEILQVLGLMLFEKTPIKSLFHADFNNFSKSDMRNQLYLFNL
jgi:hypothetical protein